MRVDFPHFHGSREDPLHIKSLFTPNLLSMPITFNAEHVSKRVLWMLESFHIQSYFSRHQRGRVRPRIKRFYPGIAYNVVRCAWGLGRIVTSCIVKGLNFLSMFYCGEWGSFRHRGVSLLPLVDGPHYSQ